MSIYGRRKSFNDLFDVQQKIGRDDDEASRSPATSQDWDHARKARPVNRLLPLGERWLGQLSPAAFPTALVRQYPRIVNLLALHWEDRLACPAYFEELLVDRRGGRRGFPTDVLEDLQNLREYWYTKSVTTLR
jgi:hypothetical protein